MKTRNKVFWVVFFIILITIIYIISVNYQEVNSFIEENIHIYGYPAIFLFAALADIVDQPIIPEIPSILGMLYGLNILFIFLFAVAGIWIMSIINFNIGKRVLKERLESVCGTNRYTDYCRIHNKYGKLALLLAALTPLPYVSFVWISGAFGMKFRDFFIFGMLAKILRLGSFLLLAYWIFF